MGDFNALSLTYKTGHTVQYSRFKYSNTSLIAICIERGIFTSQILTFQQNIY